MSDKLFTGFLEGASAIFQSVKVAFLPSEQCLIVVRGVFFFFLSPPQRERKRERESERAEREGGEKGMKILRSTNAFGNIFMCLIFSPLFQLRES